MSVRAAIAQTDSRVGDVEGNVRHHMEFIDRARSEGARLILFPELSLSGYSLRDLAWDTAVDIRTSRLLDPLKQASRSIAIVAGIAESGEDHGIYNSAVLFEEEEIKHIHRKIYPPTYGMFEEGRYFRGGREVRAVSSSVGRLGMLICEDCWHLSLPYLLAIDGAEILLCLTASPTRMAGDNPELDNAKVNHEHQRVYARLLSTYVLFANRVGFEDGVNFWGGSLAVDPFGNPIRQAPLFKEDLILVDVETSEVQRARRFSRHFLDENLDLVKKHLLRLTEPS